MLATSVVLIECEEEAYARFLHDQWPSLQSWCGLFPTHGPVEVHRKNVVIALTWGGQFKPEETPTYVRGVKVFAHSGDFHIARQELLAHNNTQVHPETLFGGKS